MSKTFAVIKREFTESVRARTFLVVFPDTQAWLLRFNVDAPVVGLIGHTSPVTYSTNWLETLVESPLCSELRSRFFVAEFTLSKVEGLLRMTLRHSLLPERVSGLTCS